MHRRKRKARLVEDGGSDGLSLVQFIPGGFYWRAPNGALFTGVHRRPASDAIKAKLADHATRARYGRKEWVL